MAVNSKPSDSWNSFRKWFGAPRGHSRSLDEFCQVASPYYHFSVFSRKKSAHVSCCGVAIKNQFSFVRCFIAFGNSGTSSVSLRDFDSSTTALYLSHAGVAVWVGRCCSGRREGVGFIFEVGYLSFELISLSLGFQTFLSLQMHRPVPPAAFKPTGQPTAMGEYAAKAAPQMPYPGSLSFFLLFPICNMDGRGGKGVAPCDILWILESPLEYTI